MFVASGLDSQVYIRNITFGALPTLIGNPQTPQGTNRNCILLNGHGPQFLYGLTIENCYFFNFNKAVLVTDSWTQNTGDGSGSYVLRGVPYYTYLTGAQLTRMSNIASGTYYQIVFPGTTTNWSSCASGTVTGSGTLGTKGWIFLSNGTIPNGTGTLNVVSNYYEWGVNPLIFRNCRFLFNQCGVLFNSNQIDAVRFEDCNFIPSNSGDGIMVNRCGFIKLDNCFSTYYNGKPFGNFVRVQARGGVGSLSNNNIVFNNCQAESIGNFLFIQTGDPTTTIYPTYTVRDSIFQIGANITLGAPCEFISQGNSVQAQIYISSTNVRCHSFVDNFIWQNYTSGTTWGFSIVAGDAWSIWTMVPGRYFDSACPNTITNGLPNPFTSTTIPSSAYSTWTGVNFPQGMFCGNSAVTPTSSPGWYCTTPGTGATAIWTAAPAL